MNRSKGKRLMQAEGILLACTPLAMLLIAAAFPTMTDGAIVLLYVYWVIALHLIMFGIAVRRAPDGGFMRVSPWRLLSSAQRCLSVWQVSTVLFLFFSLARADWLCVCSGFSLAGACVLYARSAIRNVKKRRAWRAAPVRPQAASTPSAPKAAKPEDTPAKAATDEAIRHIALHTPCALCGEDHPKSEMFLVDGASYCQRCFGRQYAPDLH